MRGIRGFKRPAHGTIVGYTALFIALTGSAWAAVKVGSNDIASNAIQSRHVAKDALTGDDIREGTMTINGKQLVGTLPNTLTINGASLTGTLPETLTGTLPNTLTINGSSLTGTIPSSVTVSGDSLTGTIPASSITGISDALRAAIVAQARPLSASIDSSCSLSRGVGTISIEKIGTTRCDVKFNRDVSACFPIASPRDSSSGIPTGRRTYKPLVAGDNTNAGGTTNLDGLASDEVAILFDDDPGLADDTSPAYLMVAC